MPALLSRRAALRAALALAAAPLALAACGDDPAGPAGGGNAITVSGTLRNARGTAIPADARVVLLWSGDDGSGDYSYVWGSGTVDVARGRFTVTLDGPPPAAATFRDARGARLGVAFAVLVPAADAREGRVTDPRLFERALGAAGQQAVIFREGTTTERGWWSDFPAGYAVGRGVPARPGETFDSFVVGAPDALELVVDRLDNIRVVNWT